MSQVKHKARILAAIDHLRARKARPDINRICEFMLKKFKITWRETKAGLKKCIDSGFLFKVDYKGDISYRKTKLRRTQKNATVTTKDKMDDKVMMASTIAQLIFNNSGYLMKGVPSGKLVKAISTKQNPSYSRKSIEAIIHRELENGGLMRLENGNYMLGVPGERDQDSMEMDNFNADSNTKMTSSNNSSSSSPMRVKGKPGRKKGSGMNKLMNAQNPYARTDVKRLTGVRVGERHKRAKKVFDPSDNNVPVKKKRGRPVGSLNKTNLKKHSSNSSSIGKNSNDQQKTKSESAESSEEEDEIHNFIKLEPKDKVSRGCCSVCRQQKSSKDSSVKLVTCRDCSNQAHPSCLRGDGMLRLCPDSTWQCHNCITCVVCMEASDAGILTVCNLCSDAYHALCHSPPIPERLKAWDQWECNKCQEPKNTDHHLDNYIDKLQPSSDHSSKNSDRSDSRRSNTYRKRDKSSVKSVDSDDRNESKLIIAEKDDRSYSPLSVDNSDWKYTRRLSPARNSVFEWKQGDGKTDSDIKKTKSIAEEKSIKPKTKSIYMDNHEQNKLRNVATYQKHPNCRGDEDFDPSIPSAEGWNYHDVYNYFLSYFPEEAQVFKEQEIDGKSLLMMRRSDVIRSFGLPLGPALKVYRHIVKLQSRKDDFTMCWL